MDFEHERHREGVDGTFLGFAFHYHTVGRITADSLRVR